MQTTLQKAQKQFSDVTRELPVVKYKLGPYQSYPSKISTEFVQMYSMSHTYSYCTIL